MDKLKKIFSPGASKDDEVLYGDAEARRQASISNAAGKAPEQQPEPLRTHDHAAKKEHGVLRQILNPGGEKHDEQAFGANATTEPADPKLLQTKPEHKDHTILGQILNPGGDKYDEQRFGTTAQTGGDLRRESVRPEAGEHALVSPDATLATENPKKEHTILRQLINPGGENYDSAAYGRNASVVDTGEHTSGTAPAAAATSTAATQHTGYSQPAQHGSAVAGGSSAEQTLPDRTAQSDTSHFGRDAAIAGGVTGAAGAGTYAATRGDDQPYAQSSTTSQTTTLPTSTQQQPPYQSTTQQPEQSHLGRDAAIIGGTGTAGAGTYPATHHRDEATGYAQTSALPTASQSTQQPAYQSTSQQADNSHLGRDAAIVGGVGAAGAGTYAAGSDTSSRITDRPHPLSNRGADAHINPVSAPEAPEGQADSHLPGSIHHAASAVTGTYGNDSDGRMGTGPIDVGHASIGTQQTGIGSGHDPQLNQAPSDVQNATYTERAVPLGAGYRHYPGPHSTDTGNRLDPHIPGEFPTEEGEDPHRMNPAPLYAEQSSTGSGLGAATGAGLAGAGAGAATYGISHHDRSQEVPSQSGVAAIHPGGQSYPVQATAGSNNVATPSQPYDAQSTSHHHYGRDAAIAGGAGAAGVGAYETTRSNDDTGPASQTIGPHDSNVANIVDPRVQPDPEKQGSHHYGRDAAVLGGTGAAGAAAYGATQSHANTGPASSTIGPHESNIANVVDPRVQPDLSQMKGSTSGPHQSNIANRADPRVESDASKHDTGRDAALLAGGAGAGAAAGLGAEHALSDKEQKKLEKQHEKELEKEHKEAEKEAKKQEKQHQKEVAKEEKAHQKEAEKQEKQHQKEVAKQEKEHEKIVAKEEKKHQQEVEKQEKAQQKELDKEEKQAEKEREKHEKELAAAGAGAAGAGAYETNRNHEEAGRSSYDTNETGHSGGERKRGLLDKILHPTRKSEDDDRVVADDDGHNKLHKKHVPKAHEQGQQSSPLAGGATSNQEGLVAGPPYEGTGTGTVTEPHTGLPMNVGQHGTGVGGTDGAEQIQGYHQHPTTTGTESGTATGPDWNAIKKENTPY